MKTVPHDGNIFKLCDVIRETSYEIHKYLRSGFTEKIYENALAHRLRKRGIRVEQQECIRVFDEDGTLLGLFRTDILIERALICEIKSCSALVDGHTAQLLGYLRATGMQQGLLTNFGVSKASAKEIHFDLTSLFVLCFLCPFVPFRGYCAFLWLWTLQN